MAINFIPNDPRAGQPPNVQVTPHPDRPAGRADFLYQKPVSEAAHPLDSDAFLFWQCREAALRAVKLWELIVGQPLTSWQSGTKLRLQHKSPGAQLNAFYDRSSLAFFQVDSGNDSYRSGASTDVVAHEAGHAFLDAIRPDLWGNFFGEQGAFHEAFGDCIAILTALEDQATRHALLGGNLLRRQNFVESTAEDLANGIGALINPNHNAAVPRTALNSFQWVLPASLPVHGGPGALINEVHAFGMLFSGCFYDTLTNIFEAGANQTEAGLLEASRTAGRLLAEGARTAPLNSRFFRSVGNAMLLADQNLHGGANAAAIQAAFAGHNVQLDTQQMLAPSNVLAGRAPAAKVAAVRDVITPASRRDLVGIVGAAVQQRFFAASFELGDAPVPAVRHQHKVPLGDSADDLEGVVCLVEEDVLIGSSDGQAAALGVLPTVASSVQEVQNFVYSLSQAGQIDTGEGKAENATHVVRKVGEERRLLRKRYACGTCRGLKPAPQPG